MKHHPLDGSSSDGLTSYSHQPQVVADKIIYHAAGWENNVTMNGVLTCHLLSILSHGGYWYPSAGRRGKTMPNHHGSDCPVNHGLHQPWSDYPDHATLARPVAIPCSNPGHDNQCRNMFRCIRRLTRTWDRNALLVIWQILLMKFIAAILHSSELTLKWSRT